MTHPLKILFFSLLTLSATQGFCSELEQTTLPSFEVKTGYFFFSNSTMRKVYDKGGLDLQLCASYPFWDLATRWTLNAYGAIEYFHRTGKSLNNHQRTSIWSVPINLGLKPVYEINEQLQYYFALGPRYFYIHQHNNSSYVKKHRSRNGLGLFVNTGFNYLLCDGFLIDIFGEYSYAKMHLRSSKNSAVYTKSIQIGGFTLGCGVGHEF